MVGGRLRVHCVLTVAPRRDLRKHPWLAHRSASASCRCGNKAIRKMFRPSSQHSEMLKALYAEWGGEYKMRTVGPVTAPDSGTGHTEKAQVLDGLAAALRPRQFSAEARHAVVSKVIMLGACRYYSLGVGLRRDTLLMLSRMYISPCRYVSIQQQRLCTSHLRGRRAPGCG